jgi:SAM-dependent methyltransferase
MDGASDQDGALEGGAFYDDAAVFETYRAHRLSSSSPNELVEEPAFVEMFGRVEGMRVLDLGCGDAAFGRRLLDAGCRSFTGVDASSNMVRAADRNLHGTAGVVLQANIETIDLEPRSFDLVLSRLALHYVDDLAGVLRRVQQTLAHGGRLVFSVEHPVITSCDRGWDRSGPRGSWLVDDYFQTGRRETSWLGSRVVKYHRTVEDYVSLVQQAGFRLDTLREARPRAELFASPAEYYRRSRIPLFLLLAATLDSTTTSR